VKQHNAVVDQPADQLSELRGEHPSWLDISNPQSEEFALVAQKLELHPRAVEDAQHGHQRPKIDQYETHYFIVFYALETPSPGVVTCHEVSIFVAHNAIVTVHQSEFAARKLVEKRFIEAHLQRRSARTCTARTHRSASSSSSNQICCSSVRPSRRSATCFRSLRGDTRDLRGVGKRAYFQDVYDHILRVTDETDTFRELSSNVIDAYLAAASNRLNGGDEGLHQHRDRTTGPHGGHRLLRPELDLHPVRVAPAVLAVHGRDGWPVW
jgi:magnesium transporter